MSGQPIAALAQLLGIDDVAQIEALIDAGILPKPSRSGTFDLIACNRAYLAHLRGRVDQQRIDWPEARRRFEFEGWSATELAPLIAPKGVTVQGVSYRARKDGWTNQVRAARDAKAQAIREFVLRDAAAITENLAVKHELNRDLLGLARTYANQLIAGEPPPVRAIVALRQLTVAVRNIETVDSALAQLRDGKWRKPPVVPDLPLPENLDVDALFALLGSKPQSEEQVQ